MPVRTRTRTRTIVAGTGAVGLALLGIVAVPTAANAATTTVTDQAELASAITNANAAADADTIVLANDITVSGSLPTITENLTIQGNGHTITADAATTVFTNSGPEFSMAQVSVDTADFGVLSTQGTVTIEFSTFSNAKVKLTANPGTLTVRDSSFSGVTAGNGIELELVNSAPGGESSLERVTASDNDLNGIVLTGSGDAKVTVSNVAVTGNGETGLAATVGDSTIAGFTNTQAQQNVDGVSILAGDGAVVVLENTSASANSDVGVGLTAEQNAQVVVQGLTSANNDLGLGLGAADSSTVTVKDAATSANRSIGTIVAASDDGLIDILSHTTDGNDGMGFLVFAQGGVTTIDRLVSTNNDGPGVGVFNIGSGSAARVSMTDSTIASNTAQGLFAFVSGADVMVERTTISGNGTLGADGGGILVTVDDDGSFVLSNSTVSGNVGRDASGIAVEGTVAVAGVGLVIDHSTVVDNVATSPSAAGVLLEGDLNYRISHSVLAGNVADGSAADLRPDVSGTSSESVTYSLVQAPDALALPVLAGGAGNLTGLDPMLGPLSDNGGFTRTHLPLAGSPVVGSGNPAITGAPATDQRGEPRIVGVIDLGAVERGTQPAADGPILAVTGADPAVTLVGGGILTMLGLALVLFRRRRAVASAQGNGLG